MVGSGVGGGAGEGDVGAERYDGYGRADDGGYGGYYAQSEKDNYWEMVSELRCLRKMGIVLSGFFRARGHGA